MPSYPNSPNQYPATRNAYPVTPKSYPGTLNRYPGSAVTLLSSVFSTAFQILQFDIGLLYGAVPKATAGNTSTTVIALTGVIAGVAVPIWVVATNSASVGAGAQFSIYYDGGLTPAMTGVTPTVGTPVALTGAGAGMSVTFSSGTSVSGNSWKATCAGLADLSNNGWDALQLTIAQQPIVTVGVNGKPGLLTDGVDDRMGSSLVLPAPGTTAWRGFLVARRPTTAAGFGRLISDAGDSQNLVLSGATSIQCYSAGNAGPVGTGLPTNTWGAIDWGRSNDANDYIQTGSGPVVSGAGQGNAATGTMGINGSSAPCQVEYLAVGYVPAAGFSSAAFRAAVTAIWGAGVAV